MNKLHIICISLCLLLTACYKDPEVWVPERPGQPEVEEIPISLSASSSDMLSRAIIADDAGLQATNLGVFAYKKVADNDPVLVFNNVKLEYTDGAWTYSPLKYWDRTATYYFVSYSPRNKNVEYSEDSHQLTIKNIPNWQAIDSKAKDYVVANDFGVAEGGYITPNGARPVNLGFKHILCQLEVRVLKNPFLMNTYTLSGISYKNVPTVGESATYLYSAPTRNNEAGAPMEGNEYMSVPINTKDAQSMATPNAEIPGDPAQAAATTIKHLVAPFSADFNITLNYKINDGDATSVTVDAGLDQLESNNRYVITLTFNSGADIEAEVEVMDWVNKEVETDDKYNW
ncbi:MAG: fimbrillin family protein [Bacteroidales bacterium]|nr:fimbrillin family protein [Bacteroidales bacterium]